MDFQKNLFAVCRVINTYRVHIFIFLLVFFIGLTFSHPSTYLNDESITTNQLRQLHAGHQIIINEGKYGLLENGSMSGYYAYRSNVLGYSLFLPVIALPTHWIIDVTGKHCSYLILILWTILALVMIMFIDQFFPNFSKIRNARWTSYMTIIIFIVFFINLYYYSSFPVEGYNNFPEVIAIVFTNIILLAISAPLIYETMRSVFIDPTYSFFAAMVCLFSSSFFFWSTFCKDHVLIVPFISALLLCIVKFICTDDYWYLPLIFLITGLLAWARPEIALWICLFGCLMCLFILSRYFKGVNTSNQSVLIIICSPFFTLIGALPFFLNNYLITKNFLLPAQTLYLSEPGQVIANSSASTIRIAGVNSISKILMMFLPSIPDKPEIFFSDLIGTFLLPQTGSIGVFALTPLFVLMVILGLLSYFWKKNCFDQKEKTVIIYAILFAAALFFTYLSQLQILNNDYGIVPDIRYLSPMYLPLNLIGLIILYRISLISNYLMTIKRLTILILTTVPLSIICLAGICMNPEGIAWPLRDFNFLFTSLSAILIIAAVLTFVINKKFCRGSICLESLIILLLILPFLWQINLIFYAGWYNVGANYTYWIPIIRVFSDTTAFNIILAQ